LQSLLTDNVIGAMDDNTDDLAYAALDVSHCGLAEDIKGF
jgi:hypothetical protein